MIRTTMLLLTLLVGVALHQTACAGENMDVKVMTFNIRCDTSADGKNQWPHRREMVGELVRRFHGDFVGFQEVLPNQMADLRKMLPECRWLGRSREADPKSGEACPIFYRHDRWRLDPGQQGVFWLSDAPQKAGSTAWNTACPRIATWGRFIESDTGRGIYVFNTHLDHMSEMARQKGAALLAQRIAARANPEPVILMGDFNSDESGAATRTFTEKASGSPVMLIDTFRALHPKAKNVSTFHGFQGGTAGEKIDYILVLPQTNVRAAEILHDNRNGRYPSDHFPMTAEISCPAGNAKP